MQKSVHEMNLHELFDLKSDRVQSLLIQLEKDNPRLKNEIKSIRTEVKKLHLISHLKDTNAVLDRPISHLTE